MRAPTAPTTATLAASAALLSIIGGLGLGVGGGVLGRFGVITGLVVRRVPAPRAGRPRISNSPTTTAPPRAPAGSGGGRRGGLILALVVRFPVTGIGSGTGAEATLIIRPVTCTALVTRGGRRLLRSGGRGGDPPTPAGPTGIRGLEQQRGSRKTRSLRLLLMRVHLPGPVVVGSLGHVGVLLGPLILDQRLALTLYRVCVEHGGRRRLRPLRLRIIGLTGLSKGGAGLSGWSRLGSGGGRNHLAATTRRGRGRIGVGVRGGRNLRTVLVNPVSTGGGDTVQDADRAGLFGSGRLGRGSGSGSDSTATTRSRGTQGVSTGVVLLVRVC